jgi:hypothetical protein
VCVAIYDAVRTVPENFSSRATDIQSTFNWPPETDNSLFWTELLTGISTALTVAGTLISEPAAAGASLLAGLISGGIAALPSDSDTQSNLTI